MTNSDSTLSDGTADPEGTVKRVMSSKWYAWKKTDLADVDVLSKSENCVGYSRPGYSQLGERGKIEPDK